MIIKSIQAKNHLLGWELEEITFDTNPTLLVGLSGVGKTQILQTIQFLKFIALGNTHNGLEWELCFENNLRINYIWKGRFSLVTQNQQINNEQMSEPEFLYESLQNLHNSEYIIKRDKEIFEFSGTKIPKMNLTKSFFALLEVNEILNIKFDFYKITLNDYTIKPYVRSSYIENVLENFLKENNTLKEIKGSKFDIIARLFFVSSLNLDVFYEIKQRIIEAFPQLIDLKIENPKYQPFTILLSIKEKGVEDWIEAKYISSGMLRTIIHIAQIYLANDGSVILIDEFENSLGTNCMDILTEDLIHENKNIQFIATSHHPYIINALPYQYWKIVTRKAGVISAKNASEYKLGKSKQKAFIQLTEILENQYQ